MWVGVKQLAVVVCMVLFWPAHGRPAAPVRQAVSAVEAVYTCSVFAVRDMRGLHVSRLSHWGLQSLVGCVTTVHTPHCMLVQELALCVGQAPLHFAQHRHATQLQLPDCIHLSLTAVDSIRSGPHQLSTPQHTTAETNR
jgi:hypothetical protein